MRTPLDAEAIRARSLPHHGRGLEYLQVNLRTVYRLIKAGSIPAVRVGRQWRFRKQDIDAWLEGRTGGAAHEGRRRLLLVDDDEGTRILLSKTLATDYDVETATDGPARSTRCDGPGRLRPHDRRPEHAGHGRPHADPRGQSDQADLPIIIITGYSTESSAIEAVNLGVAGYLTKPFRDPQVLEAAARALGAPAA